MPSTRRPPLATTLLSLSLAAASLTTAAHRSSQSGTGVPPVTPPSTPIPSGSHRSKAVPALSQTTSPRQEERLDRSPVALPLPSGAVFLSWRSLRADPPSTTFHIWRPTHRIPSLMQDHVYRMGIAWQNAGYNQPAHTSSPLSPSPPR